MVQPLQSSVGVAGDVPALVDRRLAELVPAPSGEAGRVARAVHHSLLGPGKRLRPAMLYRVAESLGADPAVALDPGCAIEMVHTASLILDDLPCMDDSDLRRGRASCHSRFGTDTAMLATIALLNRAYFVLSDLQGVEATVKTRLVRSLARAISDCSGMVAGQMRDLSAEPLTTDLDGVRSLAAQKTAGLFGCAAKMGALLADADPIAVRKVREFALEFGLCFQVLDDLADFEASTDVLGKEVGKDAGKATFVTLLGPQGARRVAREHARQAMAALDSIGLSGSPVAEWAQGFLEPAGL